MSISLLIPSNTLSPSASTSGKWVMFEVHKYPTYLKGINTGAGISTGINAEDLNRMLSGVPSIWARPQLLAYAFKSIYDQNNANGLALQTYFNEIVSEWKGLVALLALYPEQIRISAVYLEGQEKSIPAIFGRMLFDDTVKWGDPNDEGGVNRPFLQMIYYKNVLIGATSPYSLVFPSVEYDLSREKISWFKNGRLVDPVESNVLSNVELQQLYLLVNNILKESNVAADREQAGFKTSLEHWINAIRDKNRDVTDFGSLNKNLVFKAPFDRFFLVEQKFFEKDDGQFTSVNNDAGSLTPVPVQNLLLDSEYIHRLSYVSDEGKPLDSKKLPVILLVVPDPRNASQNHYFPIPLGQEALKLFRGNIGDLVGATVVNTPINNNIVRARLSGRLKDDCNVLEVELTLNVDGKSVPLKREYKVKQLSGAQGVIATWPDFIHKNWKNYYYYSEYPTNYPAMKAIPYFRERDSESTLIKNGDDELILWNGDTTGENLKTKRLVKYPAGTAGANDPAYEIIKSNQPIAGVELRASIDGKDHVCGYLVLKKPSSDNTAMVKCLDSNEITDCRVGIDFGSNNSCIWFSDSSTGSNPEPVSFVNRRVFLLGCDIDDPERSKIAQRHELLFFQNEKIENGQIKSWLQEHVHRYVEDQEKNREISGGMTIFENNLLIRDIDNQIITTNAGPLHYSMKWRRATDVEQGNISKNRRSAFMQALWIQVCANLFANKKRPVELRWSYPGAFTLNEIVALENIYKSLEQDNPIANSNLKIGEKPAETMAGKKEEDTCTEQASSTGMTEAMAVCNYLLGKSGGGTIAHPNQLVLGIDVGGSTSDILIMGQGKGGKAELLRQSSIRLAAGTLSDVALRSQAVQQDLLAYHNARNLRIANIEEMVRQPKTASYFLNTIFDRIKPGECHDLYDFLSNHNSRHLLVIPSYICGALMFYSGQLVASIAKENKSQDNMIDEVKLRTSGKGGRLFDWLCTYPGERQTKIYLTNCFVKGLGELNNKPTLKFDFIADNVDKKSEVAQGLLNTENTVGIGFSNQHLDIFGENSFSLQSVNIDAGDQVTGNHFKDLDAITFPKRLDNILGFLEIFINFCGRDNAHLISDPSGLIRGYKEMNSGKLKTYIQNDPEWRIARQNYQRKTSDETEFEFKHSMLMLEAMCFLEDVVIPEICRNR